MEIGRPGDDLPSTAALLVKTWNEWANEPSGERKEHLQQNVEFIFNHLDGNMASLKKEWRLAFPNPPAEFMYFEKP